MAERPQDMTELLHAAAAQRAAQVARTWTGTPGQREEEVPVELVVRRTRAAVRAARRRRGAVAAVGAAAVVAVVATAVAVWSPRTAAPPAGPGPASTSTGAQVPGLSPLRQADEDDLRDVPEGSVLALWGQGESAPGGVYEGPASRHLLLVRPDGEVLEVGPAIEGAMILTAWDRAAGTVGVYTEGETSGGWPVVDLASGQVVASTTDDDGWGNVLAPDGTTRAWVEGARFHVRSAAGKTQFDLPASTCASVGWVDATQVLLDCPALDETTLQPAGQAGASTVLVDATTGAITQHRRVAPDEPRPVGPAVRTAEGTLVAPLSPPSQDDSGSTDCTLRLGAVTGLDVAPLAELPATGVAFPGLASVPGRLLVAGTACDGFTVPAAQLWSVDVATGEVTTLLPAAEDKGPGIMSWTTGR